MNIIRKKYPALAMEKVVEIAITAGDIIMQYYAQNIEVMRKEDNSPVTVADQHANAHIVEALQKLHPTIPVVAEENTLETNLLCQGVTSFWLVDPLDGTKEFIRGTGEFTVNIALIMEKKPVAGVVYIPATKTVYYTDLEQSAYKMQQESTPHSITVRTVPDEGATVVASTLHFNQATEEFIQALKVNHIINAGSSLKFCYVAEGKADIYPRFGRTMEWDTAAGHAVLRAAGGEVRMVDETPLMYGKPNFENPFFIARGKPLLP